MPLTTQDQQAIVAAQNAYRADPAVNAPNLQWDSTLATGAQTWADNLATNVHQLQHSDPSMRQGLGENIASATTGSNTPAQMVDFWGKTIVQGRSEQAQFKPGIFPNVSKDGGPVGHYTQMIWKTTASVGCGIATDSTNGNTYLVCRYSPQGNMAGVGVPSPQPVTLAQVSVADATNAFGVDAANNVYWYTSSDGGIT
jgi:Cysteine-rich secretory protein family